MQFDVSSELCRLQPTMKARSVFFFRIVHNHF